MQYRIGCSGFYNKHWKGIFYPENMPSKDWFSYYAEHFNSLELNVTFYSFPKEETLKKWRDKSPEGFNLSVKAPKLITHLKKFNDCNRLLDDFYMACEKGLGSHLGCLLFQLPPSVKYTEEMLEKLCSSLKPGFKNVIEFRHLSWWDKKVFDTLKDNNIIFCSVSHNNLPEDIIVTGETAYIRLHGVPEMFYSEYTTKYLQDMIDRIVQHKNLKEVYIYFNNTASTAGIMNAGELKGMVSQ